jgi:hypothetical protein
MGITKREMKGMRKDGMSVDLYIRRMEAFCTAGTRAFLV